MEAVDGATVTVVTTGGGGGDAVTAMEAVPDFPAHEAVIVADPAATPVTTPLELTVAAAPLLVDQVILCPLITFPSASLTVAVNATVPATLIEAVAGATVTVVTTGGGGGLAVTVIAAVADLPAHDAVMVADPAATPVTTPPELTVATAASLVDQVMVCPFIKFPSASLTVACRFAVAPTPIEIDGGVTVTVVTVGGGGGSAGVDAEAMFDAPPKVASLFSVPRKAISWKL